MAVRADALRRAIAHALASAPGLGALAVAVGQLGINGAARVARTRRAPPALRAAWGELGYTIEQLPSAEDFRLLLVGVEVRHALYDARHHDPSTPLASIVKLLNYPQADVVRGLRLVRVYNVRTAVVDEELGAI